MTPARRTRAQTREWLIDTLDALHRKPTAAPTVSDDVAISAALTMFCPGPAAMVGPNGIGVRLIKYALRLAGYKITAMEREDYEQSAAKQH